MMMGIALLFVIGLGFSAVPTQQSPSPEADLAKARAKWTAGHVSSYEFTLRVQGMYPPPFPRAVVFHVANGTSTSLTEFDSRWRTLFERLGSIDKLFAFIEGKLKAKPDGVRIAYDATLGYPTDVFIDPSKRMADEEEVFQVADFKRLASTEPAIPAAELMSLFTGLDLAGWPTSTRATDTRQVKDGFPICLGPLIGAMRSAKQHDLTVRIRSLKFEVNA